MLTTWDYSPQTEANRLLHNAHQIATGFYKLNGFMVLPYGTCPSLDNCVSLPNLNYLSIPRFWSRAGRVDVTSLPIVAPTDLVAQTKSLMAKANLPKPSYQATQKLWAKHEAKIIKLIYQLIPHKANSISNIIIWPTSFGTGCSFNRHRKHGDSIIIWLRADHGVASIVEALLSSLTRQDVYDKLGGLWQESEIIVDWLIAFSPLSTLLRQIDPNFESTLTIKQTRSKQNAKLLQTSTAFLTNIGAPNTSPVHIDPQVLTPHEKQLFELLVNKSPHPATFDEIGDLLFKTNPEAYSLEAIAKSIQRLRDKFELSGISGSFIQTKRGEGYLLIN